VILTSVILSQYTRVTDDDDNRRTDRQTCHENSRTLLWNYNVC